jgi:hypothetical protein
MPHEPAVRNTAAQIEEPMGEEVAAEYQHILVDPAQLNDVLKGALHYASLGWQVIPLHAPTQNGCRCRATDCTRVGKHPRTRHGSKDASNDPDQIRRWFRDWPDANVGIATGAESGLVVLDVDDAGECRGSDTLAGLLQTHNDSVSTMIVSTGNGRHIYYRHPGGTLKNSAGQLGVGLDVRADGGYVVAAPSRHMNGRTYTIEQDLEVEDLPDWLRAMIAHPSNPYAIEVVQPCGVPSCAQIAEGGRNNGLYKLACRLRGREGMEQRDLERVLMS